jgi:hypothetical protein
MNLPDGDDLFLWIAGTCASFLMVMGTVLAAWATYKAFTLGWCH